MYNPYSPDLVRMRQQELIAEGDRGRVAKAVRRARRDRRRGAAPLPARDVTA
jgi:hypothetical protein